MEHEPSSGHDAREPDERMVRLLALKAQMELIHARLEYLRLMLRLNARTQ